MILVGLGACGRGLDVNLGLDIDPVDLTIRVTSPAFGEGETIPPRYTCNGEDTSPPLAWSGIPESARSLVLICDDPDAPMGTWSHWVVYDLPPTVSELPAAVPPDAQVMVGPDSQTARQGTNDFKNLGYGGPCPPGGTHRYVFRLYALDADLDLPDGATRDRVLLEMRGHVLAAGRLTGRYTR